MSPETARVKSAVVGVRPTSKFVPCENYGMDGGCGVNGWSIVTAAPPSAGFAGILAGFLFTGLMYLFGKSQSKALPPVIALFSATFLILGLTSYLFTRVAGFKGPDTLLCRRMWMEGMVASGMLAAGSASLVVGLSYLLSEFDPNDAPYLDRLAVIISGGVLIGAPVLLLFTSFSFYEQLGISLSPLVYGASGCGVCVLLFVAFVCYKLTHHSAKTDTRQKWIAFTSYLVASYAIIGPVFASAIIRLPSEWIADPYPWLFAATLVVALAFPALVMVGLAGGAAGGDDNLRRPEVEQSPW